MTWNKKIFTGILLAVLLLAGCQSRKYEESINVGAEYPLEMFPVYMDAVVYKYDFNEGVIDIAFGTADEYEKVSKYYILLFKHSKYDVTAEKMTNLDYISAGKTNHYKYLLEVKKAVRREEKKLYNTIINLRITINGFTSNSDLFEATPTPQPVEKITPAPTGTPVPTDTPVPTAVPSTFLAMDAVSAVDMTDEQIFIECLDVEQKVQDDGRTRISVLLKIINYGEDETGYITTDDFDLIDEDGAAHAGTATDGLFAGGVNILPGGYCADYIEFVMDEHISASVLAMPEGLGSRAGAGYDIELAPLSPPVNAGAYNSAVAEPADISHIPTFIIGQEHTIDDALTIKLSDAQYFENHTTVNQDNLMYTFSMEFINISSNVIIPAEIRDFVLYDTKHNILVKPTQDLTPYEELEFNPIQSGMSENYHISFEIFEETGENYLCLQLTGVNPQDNTIIYKIR